MCLHVSFALFSVHPISGVDTSFSGGFAPHPRRENLCLISSGKKKDISPPPPGYSWPWKRGVPLKAPLGLGFVGPHLGIWGRKDRFWETWSVLWQPSCRPPAHGVARCVASVLSSNWPNDCHLWPLFGSFCSLKKSFAF